MIPMRRIRTISFLILAAALTAFLSAQPPRPDARKLSDRLAAVRTAPWPTLEWAFSSPEARDMDDAELERAFAYAESHRSKALLVTRHGYIVKERYAYPWDRHSTNSGYSVAKSFTSCLIGMLIDEGKIAGLDQRASDFIPQWRGTAHNAITIRHLLSMTSGLYTTTVSDYLELLAAPNQTLFALNLPLEASPGSHWEYSNAAVQVLSEVILKASGLQAKDYARERLWSVIGMWNADWMTDDAGNTLTYQSVIASAREFAKFGYLFLRRGRWVSRQVVSAGWVDQSAVPSQNLNRRYGFLWWTNADGDFWVDVPADAYAAVGAFNQRIYVVPSLDLVVVRLGEEDFQWSDNAFLGPVCKAVIR
ncbi:MAG: serine hydrolase [Candidatus Aminicenantes bacterium]|nr:serine hydrolase [Candidatus Aminicenantes bacterium]